MKSLHAACLTIALASGVYASEKPNIVLIVADDLGYGDVGCYGSTLNKTPNIDHLEATGLRLTDFHSNGPMCTPTRAAMLTGLYQQRFGKKFDGPLSSDGDHHTHIDRSGREDWWHNNAIAMEEGYTADLLTKYSIDFIERDKASQIFDDTAAGILEDVGRWFDVNGVGNRVRP